MAMILRPLVIPCRAIVSVLPATAAVARRGETTLAKFEKSRSGRVAARQWTNEAQEQQPLPQSG